MWLAVGLALRYTEMSQGRLWGALEGCVRLERLLRGKWRVGREDALRDGVRRVTAHFKDVDDRSLAAESGVRGTAPY